MTAGQEVAEEGRGLQGERARQHPHPDLLLSVRRGLDPGHQRGRGAVCGRAPLLLTGRLLQTLRRLRLQNLLLSDTLTINIRLYIWFILKHYHDNPGVTMALSSVCIVYPLCRLDEALCVVRAQAPDGGHHGELDRLVLGEHGLGQHAGQPVQPARPHQEAAGRRGEAESGQAWGQDSVNTGTAPSKQAAGN